MAASNRKFPTAAASKPTAAPSINDFVIEDVAVPTQRTRTGPGVKWPFDRLNVGQSFVVNVAPGEDQDKLLSRMRGSVMVAQRRYADKVKRQDGTAEMRTNKKGKQVPVLAYTRRFRAIPEGTDKVRVGRYA